jgi:hypothetical protein
VREYVARIATEGSLDRELGDRNLRTRVRAIRDEVRVEAARRELVELKQQLRPELAGADLAPAEERVVEVAAG